MATIYGIPVADTWIASFAISDWAIYPHLITGSSSTAGSCDVWDYDSSKPCLYCGGGNYRAESRGLFSVYYYWVSAAVPSVGFRVIILP